jgi:membrane associated rhomboid family serine protease/Flp pilus assembly protein TadD
MANCIRCGRQLPPFSFKRVCQWCVQHEAAQRGDDESNARQPVMAAPWLQRRESTITLTHVLFGANLAVYVAMLLAVFLNNGIFSPLRDFPPGLELHFGANYGPLTLSGQWWRLLTYMFLHQGAMHIFFNMWCLWDLGRLCESLYGRWTYAAIYVITGIAGGVASVGWNPVALSVGASGAIFGLAGALLASFYLGEFSLPRYAISGTLRSLAFFIGFNVLFGAGFNLFAGGSGGIDNACHAGGLVSGLALGALIARLAPQSDAIPRRAGVVAVVALAVLAAGLGVLEWRGGQMRLSQLEQTNDMVARLKLILRQQPKSPALHLSLGQVYFSRQQFSEAGAEFRRVLELQPQNVEARFYLGLTYLSLKRTDDAKATFTEMLSGDPNSAEAHYGLGLALAQQQDHQGAIAELKKAGNSGAQIPGIYYEMGNSYAKLKMYDDAIASYLKERQDFADDPDLENALADAYQAKGMTAQAQDARSRAERLKSGQGGP